MITTAKLRVYNWVWLSVYPRFTATDSSISDEKAVRLNEMMEKEISFTSSQDGICEGAELIEVHKLNDDVMVLNDSAGMTCEGAAHPSHSTHDRFFITHTAEEVDLIDLLPEDKQKILMQNIILAATKNIPEQDDCREDFTPDALKWTSVTIQYRDSHFLELDPSFAHAHIGCSGMANATIAIPDLLNLYPDDVKPKVEKVLMGLMTPES